VAGSLALAANGGELLERVRRIVGMPAPRLSVERRASGRWLLVAFALGAALLLVQRIERATDHAFTAPRLAISWLGSLDGARLMPSVAPMDSFHLPRLRLAPVTIAATPVATQAAAPVAPSTVKETPAPETAVSARSAIASTHALPSSPPVVPPLATAAAASVQQPTELASIPVAQQVPAETDTIRQRKPVATRTIAPVFPEFARTETGRVEASFTIADDGSVRDIRFAHSSAGAFEHAAEKALRQWRFDPETVPADNGIRYTQVFVFEKSRASGERCILATGSRICRDIGEGTLAKIYSNKG
jgi:TonB family protein